eukprot:scaffold11587_cov56-Phaeocystis_antarctica.AAC.1
MMTRSMIPRSMTSRSMTSRSMTLRLMMIPTPTARTFPGMVELRMGQARVRAQPPVLLTGAGARSLACT